MPRPTFALVAATTSFLAPAAAAQTPAAGLHGQAVSAVTGRPLAYASVGVPGQPLGTVADEQGRFVLANVPAQYDQDSLRVSLVGYRPYTTTVGQFRRRVCPVPVACPVPLPPQAALAEVLVRPQGRAVRRVLGNPKSAAYLSQRFSSNALGNQIGQTIRIKRPSMLEQVSFFVNRCTYDSVFYRLNVYRLGPNGLPDEHRSVLPEAVYVRFSRAQAAAGRIRLDLSRYRLWLDPGQDVAVCLELVRDLGPGELYFAGRLLHGGPSLEKDQGARTHWVKYGAIGASIDATVTEILPFSAKAKPR